MASIALERTAGQWVRIGEAASMLGVSDQTVRNWCREGILAYRLTIGGQRQIDRRSVERALGMDCGADEEAAGSTVIYARVSTSQQRTDGNLDRQVDRLAAFCKAEYGLDREALTILAEHGSGLKEDRKGYMRLIDLVLSGTVSRILIEWPDRLARYGVKTFELLCQRMNVELVVTGTGEDEAGEQTAEQEMAADIMSLITVYAARKHGQRGAEAIRMVVPREAKERILELHSQGVSQHEIISKLGEEGFRCPKTGKALTLHSVRQTLKKGYVDRLVTGMLTDKTGLTQSFIRERCQRSPDGQIWTADLTPSFTAYAQERGVVVSSAKEVVELFKKMGYQSYRNTRGRNAILGLALKG